ncbi:MAG: hypothetical protein LBJ39_01950, partial [Tannerellaceae bacterium]|nr:hypothetical protein [Tannerellaceae bacterium]
YGETDMGGPYFLTPRRNPAGLSPFAVAGYGSWITKDELRLRLLYLEDYQEETCVCRFDGDSVEMTVGGADYNITLTGRLQ